MSKNKKNILKSNVKKIIIISIFCMLAIILIYFKTDFLKTKEQLFWNYTGKGIDRIAEIISNNDIQNYNEILKSSCYTKESEISISSKYNFIKPINIHINQKGDNKEDIQNANIEIMYNNNLVELFLIKDKDYFILGKDYNDENSIGIENKNLKQIAQKFGIENTQFVPDKIENIEIAEILSIKEEIRKHLSNKYIPIFRGIIKNKNYTKEVVKNLNDNINEENNKVIVYKVDISEKEAKELAIGVLNELYNDEVLIELICEKMRLLSIDSRYSNKEYIKDVINKIIECIEDKEYTDKQFLSIAIYRGQEDVEKIELNMKNNRTIIIQLEKNRITIKQENVRSKSKRVNNISNTINTIIDSISEVTYSKVITNGSQSVVDLNVKLDFGIEKVNVKYNYVEQIESNVEKILDKNSFEYADIEKLDVENLKRIVEKALKINVFLSEKNDDKKI